MIFSKSYQSISTYEIESGKFVSSNGGSWSLDGNMMSEIIEYDTQNPNRVGEKIQFEIDFLSQWLPEQLSEEDVEKLVEARKSVIFKLSNHLRDDFHHWLEENSMNASIYDLSPAQVGRRSLKSLIINYLIKVDKTFEGDLVRNFYDSENMTERLSSFSAIVNSELSSSEKIREVFFNQYKDQNFDYRLI